MCTGLLFLQFGLQRAEGISLAYFSYEHARRGRQVVLNLEACRSIRHSLLFPRILSSGRSASVGSSADSARSLLAYFSLKWRAGAISDPAVAPAKITRLLFRQIAMVLPPAPLVPAVATSHTLAYFSLLCWDLTFQIPGTTSPTFPISKNVTLPPGHRPLGIAPWASWVTFF